MREPAASVIFDLLRRQKVLTIATPTGGESLDLLEAIDSDDPTLDQHRRGGTAGGTVFRSIETGGAPRASGRLLTGPDGTGSPPRVPDDLVILDVDAKKLPSLLYRVRLKAQTAVQERGVHVLFAAVGFLEWRASDDSLEKSISPLILVPIDLARESLNEPYKIRMIDDDIVLNPVLAERLQTDFELDLSLDSDFLAEATLDDIAARIRTVLSGRRDWVVDANAASIGLFSFSKMSMYQELETSAAIAAQNPIVRALAGESGQLFTPVGVPSEVELDDKVTPQDSFHVLDADSSQLEAVARAKAGQSLVVQGPPGTGKSQTIANIIAESLAAGKTVLFVSEKMAALEVVHKRLQQVGLAEFCLEAHSHKAIKRNVIRDLGLALERKGGSRALGSVDELLTQLSATRDRLNAYVRALHARDNPLKRSVYEIQGEVAKRENTPLLVFEFAEIANLTSGRIEAVRACVNQIAAVASVMKAGPSHPWYGSSATSNSLEFRSEIEVHFQRLQNYLTALQAIAPSFGGTFGAPDQVNVAYARILGRILERAANVGLPVEALLGDAHLSADQIIRRLIELSGSPAERGKRCQALVVRSLVASAVAELPVAAAADRRKAVKLALESLRSAVKRLLNLRSGLITITGLSPAATFAGVRFLSEQCRLALRNPRSDRRWFDLAFLAQAQELARQAAEHHAVVTQGEGAIKERYHDEIFDLAPEMWQRFTESYAGFFRFLNGAYRRDMKTLARLSRTGIRLSYREAVAELDRIKTVANARSWIESRAPELTAHLGPHFKGALTDWSVVTASLETTRSVVESLQGVPPPEKFIALLASDGAAQREMGVLVDELDARVLESEYLLSSIATELPALGSALTSGSLVDIELAVGNLSAEVDSLDQVEASIHALATSASAREFAAALARAERELTFLPRVFAPQSIRIGFQPLDAASLVDVAAWIGTKLEHLDDLDDWIVFLQASRRAEGQGLGAILRELASESSPEEAWVEAVVRHLYRLWLDSEYQRYPVLLEFQGRFQADLVERFRQLDLDSIDLASKRIRAKLTAESPQFSAGASDKSEPGILLREVNKKARHKPLRRLFREIPTLLLALKPCLMMSPLSVSQYLDPNQIHFDLVIFDEASQTRPEDAIGAIMRGAQVVVAGDEHQLPPTNFFSGLTPDAGEEFDEEAPEVYESILEACMSAGVRVKPLRWHYRSRDERLIAFSNRFIYDGRLITFPGARQDDPNRGVSFVHVENGVYDRSTTRTNAIEAARVAELIVEHAERYVRGSSKRSLGVVAFSEAQQLAILQILDKRRRERPDLEEFFAEKADGEGFFVKNLENVQGDERDEIYFSIGYGRDASGRLSLNFGPLNRAGGERRLNVAITRARYHVKVISSITGGDIDASASKSEGVRLLKLYLDYAEKGLIVLAQGQQTTVSDFDSPFETAVAEALRRRGLMVHPQVGCAGFRIDLGIVHPDQPGRYLLGIECDGETYHRQATARDRDRLRQQVLEGLGWTIHRVWSRDWIQAPSREIERVLLAYQTQLDKARMPVAEDPDEDAPTDPINIPEDPSPQTAIEQNPAPQPNLENRAAAIPYRAVKLTAIGAKEQFYEIPTSRLAVPIVACVMKEGPVAVQVVRQRVSGCWGIERVGPTVARRVDEGIDLAVRGGSVRRKGDFLWPATMTTAPVRAAGDGDDARGIDLVSPEEMTEALAMILRQDFALSREELIGATARLLGYNRVARIVTERLANQILTLETEGVLAANGEQVRLA